MLNRKKHTWVLATLFLLALLLIAAQCGSYASPSPAQTESPAAETGTARESEGEGQTGGGARPIPLAEGEMLRVAATTGIIGDIVGNVGGNLIELTQLLPVGADPHTFEPTPQDLTMVADAHVVFTNGMGLERFLDKMIANAGGEGVVTVVSAGIEPRRLSEEEAESEHQGEAHADEAVDPHVWTSPANAIIFVNNIEDTLSLLDPANADAYRANGALYRKQLEALDKWVQEQIAAIPPEQRKLVTDHATFGYYADRYGLEQVGAVIPSFSTVSEPSARELAELEDAIKEAGVKAVFVGTSVNPALSEQVARDTGVKLVPLYTGSLGTEGSGVETYVDYIRYNTNAIVEALK